MTTSKATKNNDGDGFDLEAFLAAAAEAAKAAAKPATGKAHGTERQRCTWPAQAVAVASEAGIRLPGLYPARSGGAWSKRAPRNAQIGAPSRAGDTAKVLLWQLSGKQLAETGSVPIIQVLATAMFIKQQYKLDNATAPNWVNYLVPSNDKIEGKEIGAYTSIIHQLSLMAGSIILTTETVRKI